MNSDLEFIRGNQKNFIRLAIDEESLRTYEFQMCTHNVIKCLLPFQKRSQNGQGYLYYEMSGTQSLDLLGQMQKLKRDFFLVFAKEVLKLCKMLNEYMLSLNCIIWDAKFIMYKADTQEILFVYAFREMREHLEGFNDLLEYWLEYMDYSDRELSDCIFHLYEHLQDQGKNFSLEKEMEYCIKVLEPQEECGEMAVEDLVVQEVTPFENEIAEDTLVDKEDVVETFDRKRKRGILLLLCADIIGIFVWQPLTILKICFFLSFGLCLVALYIYTSRKEVADREKEQAQKQLQERTYLNEYENIVSQCEEEEGTQFIAIEHMSGMLYNLQGVSPQYIHITDKLQLIGKDKEKVQACMLAEGISRVHASIVKKGEEYILEDLCSTNGTYVNGKNIGVRVPYVLKEGDHVRFANTEYIFR